MKIVKFFFDMMSSCRPYSVKLKHRLDSENITLNALADLLVENTGSSRNSMVEKIKNILYERIEPSDNLKKAIDKAILLFIRRR
jgi:hypothetical protein